MDQFNFKNMLLAYHAVHDDVLCESMDELGFFDDGYDYLDEGRGGWSSDMGRNSEAMRKAMQGNVWSTHPARGTRSAMSSKRKSSRPQSNHRRNLSMYDRAELAAIARRERKRGEDFDPEYTPSDKKIRKALKKLPLVTKNPKKLRKQAAMGEEYDLYDLILDHLLDEGYTDSVEGALAILENMSDEWLEDIAEGKKPISARNARAMARRARNLAFNAASETHSDETGIGIVPQGDNTARQLRTLARYGGKNVKSHIKRGYAQGRNYDPYYQELNSRNPSRNKDYDG